MGMGAGKNNSSNNSAGGVSLFNENQPKGARMKALSLTQPMAWAIFHGKDIENRTWPTKF